MVRNRVIAAVFLALMVPGMASAGQDKTAPVVRVSTSDPAVLAGAPVETDSEHTAVRGTVADAASAVRKVRVVYTAGWPVCVPSGPGGTACYYTSPSSVGAGGTDARLTCTNGGRTCSWWAPAPLVPGTYEATVWATDAAGNASGGCFFGFCRGVTIRILVV